MSKEKNTNGFDLSGLEPEETATMEVLHPQKHTPLTDGEGEKVEITVYGPDSEPFNQANRKTTNRRLKSAKAGRIKVRAEELEAEALQLLIDCTVDWNNLALDGKVLKCNPKNVRKVYKEYPWLRKQVDDFINDDTNFLGK